MLKFVFKMHCITMHYLSLEKYL